MKRLAPGVLALLVFWGGMARGQELNCQVTVNVDNIPTAQRDFLRSFRDEVERYLNTTHFTDEDMMGERITCAMDIFFKAVTGDNRYTAQVFVSSQRMVYNVNEKTDKLGAVLRILDPSGEFIYIPNQRMVHDDMSFDPLTDLLDYYAYIIIGSDLDTYTPLSGTQCFQRALNICTQGAPSQFGKDWQASSASYSRYGFVDEAVNVKYNSVRLAANSYYFDGIDLLASDKRNALANILKAVETIGDVRKRQNPTSVIVKQFFDAKYKEIGDAFVGNPDPNVFDKLSSIDAEHRTYYQDKKYAR